MLREKKVSEYFGKENNKPTNDWLTDKYCTHFEAPITVEV
jgi:hypothetical protein